jgi:predicted nucleotidyltransferase
VIERVATWFAARDDVRGVALVGSQARGDAGPDSDIDLVVVCDDPGAYVHDDAWPAELGGVLIRTREWGDLTERRLKLEGVAAELDLGFVTAEWNPPANLRNDAIWLVEPHDRNSGLP